MLEIIAKILTFQIIEGTSWILTFTIGVTFWAFSYAGLLSLATYWLQKHE